MQQKTFFKILTVSIIFILLIIGMNLPVYASITQTTNTGKIVVSGIEAGVTVSAYQLTTVNYDYTLDQPQSTPYTWVDSVRTWIDLNYPTYSDIEVFVKAVTTNTTEAQTFYSKLAGALRGGTEGIIATKTATATGEASYPLPDELTGSVELTDCQMGTYLILIENGYRVYTPSVVNLTPTYDGNSGEWILNDVEKVEIKSTLPQLTKKIMVGDQELDEDNYSTAGDISFKITADIPTYLEGSIEKKYYISDKFSDGLILDTTSIKVYVQKGTAEPVLLTEGTDYTLTTENAERPNNLGAVDFIVNFVYDNISSYDKAIVTCNARLDQSSSTVIGSSGNPNTAHLDYTNNPYAEGSYESLNDDVVVYTYGVKVLKTDKSTGAALSGAEFTLSDGTNTLYFVKSADGVYYQAESTDTGATQTLAVGSGESNKGELYIYGLDEGTYTLTETKAPDGYNKSNTRPTITIIDNNELDGILDDAKEGDTSGMYELTFQNSSEIQLPLTGGLGTVIFAASGILFVGLGVMILIIAVKKNHKTK